MQKKAEQKILTSNYVFATKTGYKIVNKDTLQVITHVGSKKEIEEHEKLGVGVKADLEVIAAENTKKMKKIAEEKLAKDKESKEYAEKLAAATLEKDAEILSLIKEMKSKTGKTVTESKKDSKKDDQAKKAEEAKAAEAAKEAEVGNDGGNK